MAPKRKSARETTPTTKKKEAEVLKAQSPSKVTKNASPAKETPGNMARKTPTKKMTDMQKELMAKSATKSGKKAASPAKSVTKTTGSAKAPDDDNDNDDDEDEDEDDDPLGTNGLYVTEPDLPPKKAANKKHSPKVKDKTYVDDHDPDDDAVEDEPEPEKKRRAARKGSVYEPGAEEEEDEELEAPVKRGRGRPRKDGTVAASSPKKATAKATGGAKPGRPKKHVAARVEEASDEEMLDVQTPEEEEPLDGAEDVRPTIEHDTTVHQPLRKSSRAPTRSPSRRPAKTSSHPAAHPGPILHNAQTRLDTPRTSPGKGRGTASPSPGTKLRRESVRRGMAVTPKRGSGGSAMSLGSLHSASEAAASAAQLRSEAEAANLRKAAAGARKSSRAQQGVGGDGESSFRVPSSRFAPVVKTASHPAASDPSDHGFPHLPPSHRPSRPSTSPPPRPPPDRSGITGPPVGVRHRVQEVLRHVATAEEQRVFDGYQERVVELPRKYRAERKADGGGAVDATANVHGNARPALHSGAHAATAHTITSPINPEHLESLTRPNPFHEKLPGTETWYQRMPNVFPFGETPRQEREISRQINADLAHNHDRDADDDEAPTTAAQRSASVISTTFSKVANTLLGRSPARSQSAEKQDPAATSTAPLRPPGPWDLPAVKDERVEKGVEEFQGVFRHVMHPDGAAAAGRKASREKRARERDEGGQKGVKKAKKGSQ